MCSISASGLLLRPYEDLDASAFALAARESAESVGRWMPWCHAGFTEHDALDWFKVAQAGLQAETAYEFGVFSADGAEFLGGAGLNQINKQHAVCNLCYWVRSSKQGQKIASRCIKLLSQFGFETLMLQRIEIVVAVGNKPSESVARNSGAMMECVARNRLLIHGKPVPASIFSLVPTQVSSGHSPHSQPLD